MQMIQCSDSIADINWIVGCLKCLIIGEGLFVREIPLTNILFFCWMLPVADWSPFYVLHRLWHDHASRVTHAGRNSWLLKKGRAQRPRSERASLWDTSNANASNWLVRCMLQALLSDFNFSAVNLATTETSISYTKVPLG